LNKYERVKSATFQFELKFGKQARLKWSQFSGMWGGDMFE